MLERIIQLDKQIPIDAVPNIAHANKKGISSLRDAQLNDTKEVK
jgi:hypothetical protein